MSRRPRRNHWHSDDETDLGPAPRIASLSLGATRDFQLRRHDARMSRISPVTLPLRSGSLLVMADPTNELWQHQLPRRGGQHPERIGLRLNLTWRRVSSKTSPQAEKPCAHDTGLT
jgi:2OG-Fe(II) oxygenase superfamily